MSIPIKDISAGDTMSSMVDKINYNFDLLSLKGGGPAGIQGIQGIRGYIGLQGEVGQQGVGGSKIYDVDPNAADPDNYQEGDMTLYGSTFYLLKVINGHKVWDSVLNISSQIETPFVSSQYDTINPKWSGSHDFSLDTFVLGINNNDNTGNSTITSNASDIKSSFVISGEKFDQTGKKYHISLIGEQGGYTIADGRIYIDYDSGPPIMKLENPNSGSVRLIGGSGTNAKYIDVGNNIRLSNRVSSQIGDDTAVVVTDKNGNVTNSVDWIVSANATNKRLYPFSNYDIGQDVTANRVGDIYLNQKSQINILDADYTVSDSFFKVTYKGLNNTNRNICTMSSYGVSFGLNGTAMNMHCDDGTHFGIRIGNTSKEPANVQKIKPPYMAFYTDSTTNGIVVDESITIISSTINVAGATPVNNTTINVAGATPVNNTATYSFSLSSDYDDTYIKKQYAPLMTVLVSGNAKKEKHSGNTLWISGADSDIQSPSEGKDVVISGGNTFGTAMSHVGGTVYIAGGNAISNTTSLQTGASGDLRRMGNIIMGINPFNHKNLFSNNVYSADTEYEKLTGTDPDEVKFFDINDIAMHANRIVVDSNANYRKATYGQYETTSTQHAFPGPFVDKPELSTFQVSGINTLKTSLPVILKQSECCNHQMLSGVMSQVFRLTKSSDSSSFVVTQTTFDNYAGGFLKPHSVYFIVDQVWQKVGNVVNVNLRAEWLAYNGTTTNPNSAPIKYPNLFHVSDYMFGYSNSSTNPNIPAYYNTAYAHLANPDLNRWWNKEKNGTDQDAQYTFTAKNNALSTIVSGRTTFTEQAVNNLVRWLYCNMYEGYANAYAKMNMSNLHNQPICMFMIPFSIENCYVSSIYGNGNVGTENVNGYFSSNYITGTNEKNIVELDPSHAFAESGNVIVGDGCLVDSGVDWGVFGSYRSLDNITGNLTLYKGTNGTYHGEGGQFRNPVSMYNYSHPNSKTHIKGDGRTNMPSSDNVWNESQFIKPIPFSSSEYDKYTYFYPQKLTPIGNLSYFHWNAPQSQQYTQNVFTPHECYRPIIGMFTTMNINYSYVLLPKLTDKFTGMNYYQPDSNFAQQERPEDIEDIQAS